MTSDDLDRIESIWKACGNYHLGVSNYGVNYCEPKFVNLGVGTEKEIEALTRFLNNAYRDIPLLIREVRDLRRKMGADIADEARAYHLSMLSGL